MVTNQTDDVAVWVNKVGLEATEKGKGNKVLFKELRRIYRSYSPRSTITQIEFTRALSSALETTPANRTLEINTTPYILGRKSLKAKYGQTYVEEEEIYTLKEKAPTEVDLIAVPEAIELNYKGVKRFADGTFVTVTKIGGIPLVIYTAKTGAECAAAYNWYLKLFTPHKWKTNLNKVNENLANVDTLLQVLVNVGDVDTQRVARGKQRIIKEFTQKVDK